MEKVEITAPTTSLRIAHLQHPDYGKPPPFAAWCGAEVIGMIASSAAPVCTDCRELQRRRDDEREAREIERLRARNEERRERYGREDWWNAEDYEDSGPSRDWFAD